MLTLGLWIVGGIISLFGALSVAELGAAMPRSGGQYVYLTEAYGPLWGFLYGWSSFSVINTAPLLQWVWRSGNILAISYPSQQAVFRWLLLYQLYS
jgi:APA family basic amino acid/polyamine antiporter